LYLSKFRQLQMRALGTLKTHIADSINNVATAVAHELKVGVATECRYPTVVPFVPKPLRQPRSPVLPGPVARPLPLSRRLWRCPCCTFGSGPS
jgi:hypothetical protein